MAPEVISLVEATTALRDSFLEMAQEFRDLGDDRYAEALDDVDGYIHSLQNASRGVGLRPGLVPYTDYWLVRDGRRILAVSDLRHRLTASLRRFGGHIGYVVRPSERRKGYGTRLLALTLEKAREHGLTRMLLTCDDDNVGSARIIEKNGGRLDSMGINPNNGRPLRRYWIEL